MKVKNTICTLGLFIIFAGQLMAQCSVSIQPLASLQFCSGNSVSLIASGSGGGGSLVLDQSQTVYTGGTSARTLAGYSEWQSFTAGITGTMVRLDIGFFTLINGTGQLKIFSGTGTGGMLLSNQTVNVVCGGGNCTLPFTVSVPITAGQVYTFQFIPGSGMPDPYGIQVEMSGSYAGGEMNLVDPSGTYPTGFDMVFNTYVAASGNLYYSWSTGSDSASTVVSSGGKYYVTVTDSVGCSAIDSIQLTEDVVTVNITSNQTIICASDSAIICTGSHYSSYLWNNGSSDSCTVVNSAGNYYITVTDVNGCSAESNHFTLNVYPLPTVSVSVNGDTLTAYNAMAYQWYLNDSLINNANQNIYVLGQLGSYTVAITDSNGCRATSNAIVISGISETPDTKFSIQSSALGNQLNINIDEILVGSTLNIYNISGALVQTTQLQSINHKQETGNLAVGMYIAEIKTKNANLRQRWIKM